VRRRLEHDDAGALAEDEPVASNGRDARCGSSLRVDIARMTANAPMFSAMIAASVPPASTMSHRPERIMSIP
jgi:hypothetical protein